MTKPAQKPKKPHLHPLDNLVRDINRLVGEGGCIARGADIDYLTWQRMPSGSLGLDIIMGGGLPRAAIVQYKGEESSGKTSMAFQACAAAQARGENVSWSSSEGFDKEWARVNGCYIPYHDKEMTALVRAGKIGGDAEARALRQDYEARHKAFGEFVLVTQRSGPLLLEATARLVRSGMCGICVLDSAGSILSEEDDAKDIGDPTRVGGNAKVIGHFVNKVRIGLNAKVALPQPDGTTALLPNKTCVIVINQVRATIGGYHPRGAPPPEAPGGYGLRHGKDVDIRFMRGELLEVAAQGGKAYFGRRIKAKCEKNKTAPPYASASWVLVFKNVERLGLRAGTLDVADEVLQHGVYYGVIQRAGAYYVLGDHKLGGRDAAVEHLRANPELCRHYYAAILDLVQRGATL